MKGFFSTLFSSRSQKHSQKAVHKQDPHSEASKNCQAKSQSLFVKTVVPNTQKVSPARALSPAQKAHLVKKGNMFLEEDNIAMAHKIFRTLKVYDGLMHVSKAYYLKGKMTDAQVAASEAWIHRDVSRMTQFISTALQTWLVSHGINLDYEQPSKENRHAILSAYHKTRRL